MPQTVFVEGFGDIDFPDEYSGEQIHEVLRRKFPPAPVTTGEALKSAAGSALQGAAQTVAAFPKTIAAVGRFIEPAITGEPSTRDFSKDQLVRAGRAIESTASELLPEDPRLRESFWLHDVPAGIGNMATMIGTGGVAGLGAKALGAAVRPAMTRAAIGIGGAAEFNDAYERSLERGDDPNTAFAKSLGYATVAMAIENRWGAGRLLNKYFPSKDSMLKSLTAKGVSKEIAKDASVNFGEEASQRAAQDVIVQGKLEPEGILREGLVGAVVGGVVGAPANVSRYATSPVKAAVLLPSSTKTVLDMETSAPLTVGELLTEDGKLINKETGTTDFPNLNVTAEKELAEGYSTELESKIAEGAKERESQTAAQATQAELESAAGEAIETGKKTLPVEQPKTFTEPAPLPLQPAQQAKLQEISDKANAATPVAETKPTEVMTPEQEYDAALVASRKASKAFGEIQKAYRARTIGDEDFLAGRKAFDKSMEDFDAAETKFIDAKNKPQAKPTPPPAAPAAKEPWEMTPDEAVKSGVSYSDYIQGRDEAFRSGKLSEEQYLQHAFQNRPDVTAENWPDFKVGQRVWYDYLRLPATVSELGIGKVKVKLADGSEAMAGLNTVGDLRAYAERRLKRGDSVPASVLAEYPDLKPKEVVPVSEPSKQAVPVKEVAPKKARKTSASQEFNALVKQYGPENGWWVEPAMADATSTKSGHDKASIMGKVEASKQLKVARLRAKEALEESGLIEKGLDTDDPAVQAALLPKLREHLQRQIQGREFTKATAKGPKVIAVDELAIGDVLDIEGEKPRVTAIDPDTGEVTLDDGVKFGRQVLEGGETIHVEKIEKAATKPAEELFEPEETPFNLAGEKAEFVEPTKSETAFGGETLVQNDLFAIEKVVENVDPFKSADAAEKLYGGANQAMEKIRKQLATVDSDKQVAKNFSKEQRARLKEVLNVLNQRSTPSKIDEAIKKSKQALSKASKELNKGSVLSGVPDPVATLKVMLELTKLAGLYAAKGVKTAAQFAAAIGRKLDAAVRQAWEDRNLQENELPKSFDEYPDDVKESISKTPLPEELPNYIGEPSDVKQTTTMQGIREGNPGLLNEPQLYYPVKSDNLNAEAVRVVDSFNGDLEKAFAVAQQDDYYKDSTPILKYTVMAEIFERAIAIKNNPMLYKIEQWMDREGSGAGQALWTFKALRERLDPTYHTYSTRRHMMEAAQGAASPHVPSGSVDGAVKEAAKTAAKKVDVAKVLKKEIAESGESIRSIMEQHAEAQAQTRRDLFNRIKAQFPQMTPAEQVELTNKLQDAFEKLRNAELKKIFAQIAQAGGKDITKTGGKALGNALPKLIRLLNTGAMNDESVWNALAPEFGLPEFTDELYDKIYKMGQEIQQAPKGLPREQRHQELLNFIVKARGLSKWDVLQSYWYNSILSGTGTQATNIVSAAINVALNNLILASNNPAQAAGILNGALRGYRIGWQEAGAMLKRGDFSNRITNEITRHSGALENIGDDAKAVTRLASNLKFVQRLMAFADTMNANSAVEARAYLVAAQKAANEFRDRAVTPQEMKDAIEQYLQLSPAQQQQAQAKAEQEAQQGVIKPEDIKRRAIDIGRGLRPADIMDEAVSYGRMTTYNGEMQGVLGQIGKSIMQARENWGVGSIPLRLIFPFVQTPVNVANEMLNYTPVGFWRLAKQNPAVRQWLSHTPFGTKLLSQTEVMNTNDYQTLRAKVFLTATGALALGLMFSGDDDDPPIDIEGGWFGLTPDQKRQLMAQGRRPWSLKIGNKYFDFKSWPAAFLLGYFANLRDQKKYLREKVSADDYTVGLLKAGYMATDMTFLNSLNTVLELATKRNTTEAESALKKLIAYQGSSLIPNITKEIDTWIWAEQQSPKTWTESMMAQIPVARSMIGRPAVNALGEVIINRRTAVDRIYQDKVESPLWSALAEKANQGVFMPVPSASATVMKNGKRVKMTADQFYQYQVESGRLYKRKLTQDLERFRKMNPQQAKDYFEREFAPLRERARDSVR